MVPGQRRSRPDPTTRLAHVAMTSRTPETLDDAHGDRGRDGLRRERQQRHADDRAWDGEPERDDCDFAHQIGPCWANLSPPGLSACLRARTG
jgi:hypothetical protein